MHIYTLVITPGPRRSAVARAEQLLARAVPRYCDYWRTGGRFSDRLGKVERPQIDSWHAAEAKRRERFETEHPLEGTSVDAHDMREFLWTMQEEPHNERLGVLLDEALIDLTRLTSELPSPVPETVIPAALITPDGRWRFRPVGWGRDDPRWSRWVNERIDRYRGGHCVVVADCHF